MKVLDVRGNTVFLGDENNMIEEYPLSQLNFTPVIGDEVEVFRGSDGTVIISKIKQESAGGGFCRAPEDCGYAPGKVQVNKWIYVLLALLIGGLGVHKFYIGRVGTGILYLLFCWTGIPSIIAFIEGILAIMQQDDGRGNIWV